MTLPENTADGKKADLREPTLTDLLVIIRRETRPIEGHDDPGAINDCWMEVFDRLALIDTDRAERDGQSKLDETQP